MAEQISASEHARRWLAVLGLWAALLVMEAWRAPWWQVPLVTPTDASPPTWPALLRPIIVAWYPWTVLLLIAAAASLVYRHQAEARRRETAALERLVAEARLETLRTQLNPHFLFNALNAISAHVERDPRTARWMLDQLGQLLRMSLEHAREQETSLERELAFIACFVDLQKVRFDDRFEVITTIDDDVGEALVPSLILQPLVENAIRHGLAGSAAMGQIEIRAWREDSTLRLSVHDDGPGLPADWDLEHGLGLGLSNTRERLRRLYGDGQSFTIADHPGGGVRVALTLPFRQRDVSPTPAETTAVDEARTRTVDDSLGS